MFTLAKFLVFLSLVLGAAACNDLHSNPATITGTNATGLTVNSIPFPTRIHWLRFINGHVLNGPCPMAPFGAVVVNHTDPGLGTLVCIGHNDARVVGNPTRHAEIVAISNCTEILQAHPYNLTPSDAVAALKELSLYTNAESCSMCASAIRFSAFKEYIFGTSVPFLTDHGWPQITTSSYNIFQQSILLGTATKYIGNILGNETDPLFAWQFDEGASCPQGCERQKFRNGTSTCTPAPHIHT